MRGVFLASVPTVLLLSGLFFACGGTDTGEADAAPDAGKDVSIDVPFELPQVGDAGLSCSISGSINKMMVTNPADPVAYCITRVALGDQHTHFTAKAGTLSSWNYNTEAYTPTDGGPPEHDVADDAAYGSSLTDFYQWAHLYANVPDFDGGGTAQEDLTALAPLLEKELSPLPAGCDGELYFNLRNYSLGLKLLMANDDAAKIDAIAAAYARQIYDSCYFPLPLAGADAGGPDSGALDGGADAGRKDGGAKDAGRAKDGGRHDAGPRDASPADAGGDPGETGDGILGAKTTAMGGPAILYEPDQVVTGAYALLDLADQDATDPDAPQWILAARQALDHVYQHARDPASGLYHASLLTTGSGTDALGARTSPPDLLSADVQATIALYLVRTYELVVSGATAVDAGIDSPDAIVPLDAALMGPLVTMGHFPFRERFDALIAAMDLLYDGESPTGIFHSEGGKLRNGYLDGLIPKTGTTLQTKSTRPNAYMFATLHLQVQIEGADVRVDGGRRIAPREGMMNALRDLLTAYQTPGQPITGAGKSTSFFNVVGFQDGYFDTVTAGFQLLSTPMAMVPSNNYTAPAVAAVIAGFNEQLVGFHQ